MHRATIVAIFANLALAQSVTLPQQLPKTVTGFGPAAAHGELPCAAEGPKPELVFACKCGRVPLCG